MHPATASGLLDELAKIAEVKTPLLPHQQRVVERLRNPDQPGLVAVHGLGSGKTLTSIAAQEALGTPSSVVVPAALQANYEKERKKHLSGTSQPANISSLQLAAIKGAPPKAPLLVVDEAHRARDTSSKTYQALSHATAEKRLLLTGSPFYNHPSDIAPLINLAAGEKQLPGNKNDFSREFIRERQVSPGLLGRLRGLKPGVVEELNPRRAGELKKTFGRWIDYYPGSQQDFPAVTREDVQVPMESKQLDVYDTMMRQAPPWVAAKIRSGLPPTKQEAQELNAFLGAVRQVSNSTAAHQPNNVLEPKIQLAFDNLKKHLDENERGKAVVYSNYLDAGINPYKRRLQESGIPHGEFTGQMNKKQRDDLVRQYNEDKLKVLLLSSAGGEGLDLKGTRLMQVLEPHWNDEKLRQVEGRGARFKSHADLPEPERRMLIQRYLATRPRSGVLERLHLKDPGKGVDEYLRDRSTEKSHLIDQFKALLPQHPQ